MASLHLTCVLSAVAKRMGTQQFPGSNGGKEILNPESLSGPRGLMWAWIRMQKPLKCMDVRILTAVVLWSNPVFCKGFNQENHLLIPLLYALNLFKKPLPLASVHSFNVLLPSINLPVSNIKGNSFWCSAPSELLTAAAEVSPPPRSDTDTCSQSVRSCIKSWSTLWSSG